MNIWRAIALCGAMLVLPAGAQAQDYPERPVTLVVGFSAGGPTDGPARILAEELSTSLGQPVVVENKPGAGGRIATNYVLSQPNDGYTLLLCTYIDPISTVLYKSNTYQIEDLQGISRLTKGYYAIAIPASLPVENLDEFIAYAKERPGEMNYGHVGPGSAPDLLTREFEELTGVDMTAVSYKGTRQAVQDLSAGRLQFLVGPLMVTMPAYDSGRVKVLGMTSPERLPVAEDIPTMSEQGIDIVNYGWLGVCAKSGTSEAIVTKLSEHVVKAVDGENFGERVGKTGIIAASSSVEEFTQIIKETRDNSRAQIEKYDLQMD